MLNDPSSSSPPPARRWAASRATSPRSPRRSSAPPPSAPPSSAPASSRSRSRKSSWAACCRPGQGQAPARQAALGAGLPLVGRLHHGQQDVRLGHEGGDARARHAASPARNEIMVAGGMESMTTRPTCCPRRAAATRLGHGQVLDHMFLDGLEDAYDKGRLMGTFAEDCADEVRLHARRRRTTSRSPRLTRAQAANNDGSLRLGDRAGDGRRPQGRRRHRHGRAAAQGRSSTRSRR